jgi:hypothetical protein
LVKQYIWGLFLTTLLAQVPLSRTPQPGTISGVLRNADGRPAFGVRVAALAKPETQNEALTGADLTSIAQTDEQGRFRLEDIPAGQYYIVAGRVDLPTYYPGTSQMESATVVRVNPGAAQAGLDFSLSANSFRTAATDEFRAPSGRRAVATRVVTEGSGKTPVSSAAGTVFLEFERTADGAITTVPVLFSSTILEYLASTTVTEFRVNVTNLPEGYRVKSIMEGTTDITTGTFKVPSALGYTIGPTGAVFATSGTPAPVQPLTVTLTEIPSPTANAGVVRVTGVGKREATQPVYLSGTQGVIFSDGSFEFRNVAPGRHTIATMDPPRQSLGATIVVGDQSLDHITLENVSYLPSDIHTPRPPAPTGGRPPGSKFPPVSVRVRLTDEKSKQPLTGGQVFVGERRGSGIPLDADGKFAIQNLLPGVYSVEILIFGYSTVNQEITVGVEDLELELTSQKMF